VIIEAKAINLSGLLAANQRLGSRKEAKQTREEKARQLKGRQHKLCVCLRATIKDKPARLGAGRSGADLSATSKWTKEANRKGAAEEQQVERLGLVFAIRPQLRCRQFSRQVCQQQWRKSVHQGRGATK